MTFTSYAQNFEDVMLWRALRHVHAGRYIDVGAQHPIVDSVSKAFYDHGWRGIHVEPVPSYAELLRQDRPDETVLQLALSDKTGILELNVIEDTGLSTAVKKFADSHKARQGLAFKTVPTPTMPMKTALAYLAGQDVHWLKIDVEGLEEEVLRGWDSQVLRPWIIVIEATVPASTELHYKGAEEILLAANYQFQYFDGLNRFYVAAEHPELIPAFSVPPNVFDAVRLSGLANSELCRGLLEAHSNEKMALEESLRSVRKEASERESRSSEQIAELSAQFESSKHESARAEMQRLQAEARCSEAEARRAQIAAECSQLGIRRLEAEANAAQAMLQTAAMQQRLDAVFASTSWQITAPLRWLGKPARRLTSAVRDGRVAPGVKRRIKNVLQVTARVIVRHPVLKRGILAPLALAPSLRRRLRAMLAPPSAPATEIRTTGDVQLEMSPATRALYAALKSASRQG
ncbi:FkbM family methyltransferase [Variovorax paradoxus]|uniref:FkbM family methyltransferase n=1 Tax=Variovorax paradoxus TaxID=34073 RepID=UPI003D654631